MGGVEGKGSLGPTVRYSAHFLEAPHSLVCELHDRQRHYILCSWILIYSRTEHSAWRFTQVLSE